MKMITISNANKKGQVVLPSSMRKALDIDEHVSLLISLQGKSITIEPIISVKTIGEITTSNYLDILRRTQGAWHDDPPENDAAIRERERAAAIRGKNAW